MTKRIAAQSMRNSRIISAEVGCYSRSFGSGAQFFAIRFKAFAKMPGARLTSLSRMILPSVFV